jgi:hypothetical protein
VTARRLFPRIQRAVPLSYEVDGVVVEGVTENLSRRGMLVRASRPPKPGESVEIRIELPTGKQTVVAGRVTYVADDSFAIEFTAQNDDYAAFLGLLVSAKVRKGTV